MTKLWFLHSLIRSLFPANYFHCCNRCGATPLEASYSLHCYRADVWHERRIEGISKYNSLSKMTTSSAGQLIDNFFMVPENVYDHLQRCLSDAPRSFTQHQTACPEGGVEVVSRCCCRGGVAWVPQAQSNGESTALITSGGAKVAVGACTPFLPTSLARLDSSLQRPDQSYSASWMGAYSKPSIALSLAMAVVMPLQQPMHPSLLNVGHLPMGP